MAASAYRGRRLHVVSSDVRCTPRKHSGTAAFYRIFINDLPDNVSYSRNSALYADDSKLYREVTSISDCQSLQDDLTELEKWSMDSRMKFNTEKCKVLTVTRKHKPLEFSYQLYGNKLLVSKEEKDLGIIVSRDLKWGAHILNMVAKAKRTCLSITNIRVRRSLFLTLVKSQLAYGSEVWCPREEGHSILL